MTDADLIALLEIEEQNLAILKASVKQAYLEAKED